MNLTLKWHSKSGDGKSARIVAEQNDGWQDVRLELDTDDVDSEFARQAMQEIIDRVNVANEAQQPLLTQEMVDRAQAMDDSEPCGAGGSPTAHQVCPKDTDGDGNCHICARSGICHFKPPAPPLQKEHP